MAIKIQVKDNQKFDRTYGTGNGTFVNRSVNAEPRTTTTSNGFAGQYGITDVRPSMGCPVVRMMNRGMHPFTYGLNTFAPTAPNVFGRFVPTFANGSNLPFARTEPFQGWTAPNTFETLGTTTPHPFIDGLTMPRIAAHPFAAWLAGLATAPWSTPVDEADVMSEQTFGSSTMTDFVPMDIYENEDEYILLAELPGASVEDVDILVEGRSLTIKGSIKPTRWAENSQTLLQEKPSFKSIERTLLLGSDVLVEDLDATLAEGILTLRLPKLNAGSTTTRRVMVAAA